MEDRNYDPNNSEENPAETTDKKIRQGNFLSQFLARRRGEKADTSNIEDDDEEEESSDGTPKRWRTKFKSFFKNVVPPPSEAGESAKRPTPVELFTWPFSKDIPKDTTETEGVLQPAINTSEVPSEPAIQESLDVQDVSDTVDHFTKPNTVGSETAPGVESEQVEPIEIHETQASPNTIDDVERTQELPPLAELQPAAEQREQANYDTEYHGLLNISHDREARATQPQAVVEKETVVERGVGSALPVALVAAEYIGRKRADRKITEAFTEKTDNLEKGAVEAKRAHEQLDRLLRQNREQLEALKQERGISSNTLPQMERMPTVVEQVKPQVNKLEKATPDKVEKTTITSRENTIKQPEIRPEVVESEPQPRQILEQVASAAEQDMPVERVFERSHEVKDDIPAVVASASSVGSIVSNRVARQSTSSAFSKDYQKQTSSWSDGLPFSGQETPEMYKQAMRAGFTAAIAIIVFGLFAYLMVK